MKHVILLLYSLSINATYKLDIKSNFQMHVDRFETDSSITYSKNLHGGEVIVCTKFLSGPFIDSYFCQINEENGRILKDDRTYLMLEHEYEIQEKESKQSHENLNN